MRTAGTSPLLRSVWQRYAFAVFVTLAVIEARLALNPVWGRARNRHLVFFPTVMLVAWLGGFRPGVVAVVLSSLAIDYFWMEPPYTLLHWNSDLVLFLVIGVAICALIQSLHDARAHADEASRSRGQVLAIVAHDLRNPLTAARMASDGIRKSLPLATEEGRILARRLTTIDRAVSRMDHLIRDLVDSTHIEHDDLPLAIGEVEVESIAREAVDLALPLAQERGIALETKLAATGRIAADRERVLQVLGNLLGNALKFTPDGGRVAVRTVEEPSAVYFEVEDSGPGIKPADLPHVFERYWKADVGGTGLGLYISESIVRGHGGRIEVQSRPGLGARFSFTIPRTRGGSSSP